MKRLRERGHDTIRSLVKHSNSKDLPQFGELSPARIDAKYASFLVLPECLLLIEETDVGTATKSLDGQIHAL